MTSIMKVEGAKLININIDFLLEFHVLLPTAELLSGKNVRAWVLVSMVSYLKKINDN